MAENDEPDHLYCSMCETCLHNCIEFHQEMANKGNRIGPRTRS